MTYGLSSDGFLIKRQPQIISDLESAIKSLWPNANVDPESVFGQLIGVVSKPYIDLWELAELVYLSQWPSSAEGVSLDYVLSYNGLTRLESTRTTVKAGLKGTAPTLIQEGKQIKSTDNNEIYELIADTYITNLDQQEMFVTVDEVKDSTTYSITIDTTVYDIDSGIGATKNSIAQALVDDITGDSGAIVTASLLSNDNIHIERKSVNFDTVVSADLSWHSAANFQAINYGKIFAPSNTLTIIETPVSGWSAVNNFLAGTPGRDIETDAEARLRREDSLQVVGAGVLEAIVARMLQDVDGVTQVKGYENRTDVTDGDGRPPHSIEIVVEGGTDEDIGNQLWNTKGGGINTYSSSSDYYDITDSNGDLQRMYFTRPILKYAWVKIAINEYYDEETFPADGIDQIEAAVLAWANSTFEIGLDIIPQRFHTPVFTIPGLEKVTVSIATTDTPGGTPSYQLTTIAISGTQLAVFDAGRIEAFEDLP